MAELTVVLRGCWSSELVSRGSPSWITDPSPETLSILGSDRADVSDALARLVGACPVAHCFQSPRLENNLQERALRGSLSDGSEILRQWDRTWVAEQWHGEVWHDSADLERRFFVVDSALTPAAILAFVGAGEWNSWAARALSLRARCIVGTCAHSARSFAASIVTTHAAELEERLPPVSYARTLADDSAKSYYEQPAWYERLLTG